MKLSSYDIVFAEIPGEVTLALNIAGCPFRCEGCHSPWLWDDAGEELTDELLDNLLETYGGSVTCVAFMGGDGDVPEVERLAQRVREWIAPPPMDVLPHIDYRPLRRLKTAWYSGGDHMPKSDVFDYVKLGRWDAEKGGLDSPTTNQRLYRIENGRAEDITAAMTRNEQKR